MISDGSFYLNDTIKSNIFYPNHDYNNNNYCIIIFNKIKEIILSIDEEFNKLTNLNNEYKNNSYELKIQKRIDQSISNLKEINYYSDNKYENIIFKQKKIFKDYYELTSNLYLNNFIKKIKELNESLNNYLYDINFMPPPINNFTISSIDLLKSSKFYQEYKSEDKIENKNDKKEKTDIIICSICNAYESTCFCEHCNFLLCKSCLSVFLEGEKKKEECS